MLADTELVKAGGDEDASGEAYNPNNPFNASQIELDNPFGSPPPPPPDTGGVAAEPEWSSPGPGDDDPVSPMASYPAPVVLSATSPGLVEFDAGGGGEDDVLELSYIEMMCSDSRADNAAARAILAPDAVTTQEEKAEAELIAQAEAHENVVLRRKSTETVPPLAEFGASNAAVSPPGPMPPRAAAGTGGTAGSAATAAKIAAVMAAQKRREQLDGAVFSAQPPHADVAGAAVPAAAAPPAVVRVGAGAQGAKAVEATPGPGPGPGPGPAAPLAPPTAASPPARKATKFLTPAQIQNRKAAMRKRLRLVATVRPLDGEVRRKASMAQYLQFLLEHEGLGGQDKKLTSVLNCEDRTCKGFLVKQGGKRKNWLERWFVIDLNMGSFIYYTDMSEQTAKGELPIKDMTHAIHLNNTEGDPAKAALSFSVITKGRTFNLRAETPSAMRAWMAVINAISSGDEQ